MALIDLNPTMGATFVGLLLGAVFHGITTLQSIFYYTTYPNDKIVLKLLVALLWLLDSLSLAMIAYGLYKYLITDFLDPLALMYMDWGLATEPIVSGIIAFIVHEFLIYRIWMLNRRLVIYVVFLAVFSLLPLALAFVASLKSVIGGERLWTSITGLRWVATTADTTTAALDLIIACTICWQLYKSRTGFIQTDKIIQRLTVYTINTGLLPTIVSIGGLIAYLVAPDTLAFEVFNIIVSKAYTNTLLATLNSRQSVKGYATNSSEGFSAPNMAPVEFKVGRPTLPTARSGDSSIDDQSEEMHFASAKVAGPDSDARAYGTTRQYIP
ncbi:uncharacterized protein LAESUDRAFT_728165 [Laetiporus sulphureus 93-53]|uniref:DUF6534 domain-containing protein n=1 Tax=Laetiporus sulphureus 93-53 TaxID=1314785 RepID=A0A165D8N0_9APHY|nr:uncharacterized protein LAESUDRAFT_728165 [Laetiporus sulphureus 93-53]KZT04339.1 hypothetical protein LAESUDRAFT_728165 [Laetiporus sulphureus 93-53]